VMVGSRGRVAQVDRASDFYNAKVNLFNTLTLEITHHFPVSLLLRFSFSYWTA
jgi:hypothetical protein